MKQLLYAVICTLCLFTGAALAPTTALAQTEVFEETQGIWRAEVIEVTESDTRIIPGTDAQTQFQTIRAQVLDGPQAGDVITVDDDYLNLDTGERFYYVHNIFFDNTEVYGVLHRDRSQQLIFLGILFMVAVITLSGWQGVRSLIALVGSFAAIFYVLLPGILSGGNPLLLSLLVAALVLFGAIFFTHGLNRESAVAYGGTMIAVGLTVLLAMAAAAATSLTGFASDGATALNLMTRGDLDMSAILLGAMVIGVLGVLDDIAVTQSAVVTELFSADRSQSRRTVFTKALRVGREHVGALVNTLILAYTGAALPLLLFYYASSSNVTMALSSELFATEIIRMIVGSIGLIMTVPIVTFLAVWYLKDYESSRSGSHHGHHHHH